MKLNKYDREAFVSTFQKHKNRKTQVQKSVLVKEKVSFKSLLLGTAKFAPYK